jgi:predicted MFS family arabinose efflux permease
MGFLGGVDGLERFLTRACYLSIGSVPVCWGLIIFLVGDSGWRFSFLLCGVIPLIAAYLGVRGKQEIHTAMSATAFGLAFASLPLTLLLASLEG